MEQVLRIFDDPHCILDAIWRYLDLSFNVLGGRIPAYLNRLASLHVLNLNHNVFDSIDPGLVQQTIDTCNFSQNAFHCPIPKWTVILCDATCA